MKYDGKTLDFLENKHKKSNETIINTLIPFLQRIRDNGFGAIHHLSYDGGHILRVMQAACEAMHHRKIYNKQSYMHHFIETLSILSNDFTEVLYYIQQLQYLKDKPQTDSVIAQKIYLEAQLRMSANNLLLLIEKSKTSDVTDHDANKCADHTLNNLEFLLSYIHSTTPLSKTYKQYIEKEDIKHTKSIGALESHEIMLPARGG